MAVGTSLAQCPVGIVLIGPCRRLFAAKSLSESENGKLSMTPTTRQSSWKNVGVTQAQTASPLTVFGEQVPWKPFLRGAYLGSPCQHHSTSHVFMLSKKSEFVFELRSLSSRN